MTTTLRNVTTTTHENILLLYHYHKYQYHIFTIISQLVGASKVAKTLKNGIAAICTTTEDAHPTRQNVHRILRFQPVWPVAWPACDKSHDFCGIDLRPSNAWIDLHLLIPSIVVNPKILLVNPSTVSVSVHRRVLIYHHCIHWSVVPSPLVQLHWKWSASWIVYTYSYVYEISNLCNIYLPLYNYLSYYWYLIFITGMVSIWEKWHETIPEAPRRAAPANSDTRWFEAPQARRAGWDTKDTQRVIEVEKRQE